MATSSIFHNFYKELGSLIKGELLLKYACNLIQQAQNLIGGKTAIVECEDNKKLLEFYTSNDFRPFNTRLTSKGEKLIQLIKFIP